MKIGLTNHPGYYPQLDSLRAIAILLVILFHWFPDLALIESLSTGPLGVTLFFVLSGFLITLILLNGRHYMTHPRFVDLYRNFMIRRMLRIFPIYYFVLFFVWAVQFLPFLPTITTRFYEEPVYYLAYGSNFLINKYNDWSDVLSIYWTLAVEEQFYLVWPIVMLLTPTRYLKFAIIVCTLLGVISRAVLLLAGNDSGVLMPTCMDSFGLGAFWAITLFNGWKVKEFVKSMGKFVYLGLFFYIALCFDSSDSAVKTLLFRTSMSVVCLYFVVMATYEGGFKSFFGTLLDNSSVKFFGKISYGIYVYHMIVPEFLMPGILKITSRLFNTEISLSPGPFKVVSLFLLSTISIISWYSLEMPFRYLKREFRLTSRPIGE